MKLKPGLLAYYTMQSGNGSGPFYSFRGPCGVLIMQSWLLLNICFRYVSDK